MAYNEKLAERIREILEKTKGLSEKKMFGGIAFLVRGKMILGILGEELMARLGEVEAGKALKMEGVRPMDFTGRPMKGYVFVEDKALKTNLTLQKWVSLCLKFRESLTD